MLAKAAWNMKAHLRIIRSQICLCSRGFASKDGETLDFTNTEKLFAHKSHRDLVFAAALYSLIAQPRIAKHGTSVLSWAFRVSQTNNHPLSKLVAAPVLWVAKKTLFQHFCAGEHMADCRKVATNTPHVRLIVDHSVEERETPADWDLNLKRKCALLQDLRLQLGNTVSFVPVKVTALVSPALLETLTTLIIQDPQWQSQLVNPLPSLSLFDRQTFVTAEENLRQLCEQAHLSNIPLLFDAEQTHRQPAIDFLSLRLMQQFNKPHQQPVVYNTYQMYLRGGISRLQRDLLFARAHNFTFAVKLVRGAYKQAEKLRVLERGGDSPLVPDKRATDVQYEEALTLLLRSLSLADTASAGPSRPASIAVVIATHNAASVLHALQLMRQHGLSNQHQGVQFAQIKGMCENLTLSIAQSHFNSNLLTLFGDFTEIFPWLLRRVDENSEVVSAMSEQRKYLLLEVRRRIMDKWQSSRSAFNKEFHNEP